MCCFAAGWGWLAAGWLWLAALYSSRLALLNFALNRLALGRLAAASASFCGIGEQHCCQREDETECSHGKTPCSLHG